MLYSCTHMATVDVKVLTFLVLYHVVGVSYITRVMTNDVCHPLMTAHA